MYPTFSGHFRTYNSSCFPRKLRFPEDLSGTCDSHFLVDIREETASCTRGMCWTPNRFPLGGRVHFLVARWPMRYFCWAAMERWSCWRFRIYGETYHTIFLGKGKLHVPASIGFTRVPEFRPITRSDLFPNWATAVWIFSLVASRQGKVQRPHGRHIGAWNGCVHGTSPWIHYIYIYTLYIYSVYIYLHYIYIHILYIYIIYIYIHIYIYTL